MRLLKFIVNKQIVEPDPNCDFSNIVPGTNGYLYASFSFSSEWKDHAKVVGFWSMMGKEFAPQQLNENSICLIPAEALKNRAFQLQVMGKNQDGSAHLKTNKVVVNQDGGKA